MPDTRRCLGPPRCRFTTQEDSKNHEPGCPMLNAPAEVKRDPLRLEHPVAAVTGGGESWTPFGKDYGTTALGIGDITGIPAAVGVEFPLTHRPGEYMGIPREPMTLAEAGLPPALINWHNGLREQSARMDIISDQPIGQPLPLAAGVVARSREEAQEALGRIGISPVTVVQLPRPDYQLNEDEAVLVKALQAAADETAARKAIDRFMASVYDRLIDDLAAKRRDHTRRLIK